MIIIMPSFQLVVVVFLFLLLSPHCSSFLLVLPHHSSTTTPRLFAQQQQQKQRKSSYLQPDVIQQLAQEEEGAGVVGAQFFGGDQQKVEFYDAKAEESASVVNTSRCYGRFQDAIAFPTPLARSVAESLQQYINAVLYQEDAMLVDDETKSIYAPNVTWKSPFATNINHPLAQLASSLDFFNRLDVALVAATEEEDKEITLRWEISVVWPALWEPRVLLVGSSTVTVNDVGQIVQQVDVCDNTVVSQLFPRFWDLYHIGMTPSAEVSPTLLSLSSSLLQPFSIHKLPPRLVYQVTKVDTGLREDASVVPNAGFVNFIQTMGPRRQRYVPTTPLEIRIDKTAGRLIFTLPVSVEVQTNAHLPLPPNDDHDEGMATTYVYQGPRLVATLPHGGNPYDENVPAVRKRLYESVLSQNQYKPKLDDKGRPLFFYWSHQTKACYTAESGLGMCVYEYRPDWSQSNQVGVELELD
jgi:hypothetical protein